jgi:prefoldin subunit 5
MTDKERELQAEIQHLKDEIASLKGQISYLKRKIKQVEDGRDRAS